MTVTLEQALKRLWRNESTQADQAALAERVAQKTGVLKDTASGWFRLKHPAKGTNRSCLLVYLTDELGMEIEEFASLDPRVQDLNRMLYQGIVKLDELRELLEYSNEQDVHRLLRGDTRVIRTVESRVNSVMEAFQGEIKRPEKGARVPPVETPPTPVPVPAAPVAASTATPTVPPMRGTVEDARVLRVAGQLMALLPDLEALVESDEPRLHEAMRRTVGPDRFVLVSTLINALTGPRPMERYKSTKPRKGSG